MITLKTITGNNKLIIGISTFNQIIIENIWFKNVSMLCGVKINGGNASKINMNSIQFINANVEDYVLMFDSLDSTLKINDLYLLSLFYTKSNFFFKRKLKLIFLLI